MTKLSCDSYYDYCKVSAKNCYIVDGGKTCDPAFVPAPITIASKKYSVCSIENSKQNPIKLFCDGTLQTRSFCLNEIKAKFVAAGCDYDYENCDYVQHNGTAFKHTTLTTHNLTGVESSSCTVFSNKCVAPSGDGKCPNGTTPYEFIAVTERDIQPASGTVCFPAPQSDGNLNTPGNMLPKTSR